MCRILIITFFIPIITMSQTTTFSKAVQQLYFNVDVKNASVDTIISELSKIADGHNVSKGMSSLSVNLDMDMSGDAKKVSHVFKFNKSPLPNISVDTGYIEVTIGGQYAEYSIRSENAGWIKDVTFFFGKSVVTNKYEVRFIPYNEFME